MTTDAIHLVLKFTNKQEGVNMLRRAKSSLSIRCIVLFSSLVVIWSLPGVGLAAGAMTISGTVSDAGGAPIVGARVIDGRGQSTYTDAWGKYTIEESIPRSYTITVSKSGLIAQSRTVEPLDALNPINFTMKYVITSSISRWAISTAQGQGSSTLNVTSYARYEGSCVYVTDNRTGQESLADFKSHDPAQGSTLWTYTLEPPQGSVEGSFSLSYIARECSTGTVLSSVPSPMGYVIDNTKPTVPLAGLKPVNGLQTMFSSQPLSVQATDGLSGITASGVEFLLRDLTSSVERTATAQQYSGGLAFSSSQALVQGHEYNFSVSVSDQAGNTTTVDQANSIFPSWLAMSTLPGPVSVEIPRVDAISITGDPVSGYEATFSAVTVTAAEGSISFSPATRKGSGTVSIVIPLGSAQICNDGLVQSCQSANLTVLSLSKNFSIPESSVPVSTFIPGGFSSLGTITRDIPATWTDPYIVMTEFNVIPTLPTCADSNCQQDPLSMSAVSGQVEQGAVINDAPFTWEGLVQGVLGTVTIEKPSATSWRETIVRHNPDGSNSTWVITLDDNGDGTASGTVVGPGVNEEFIQTFNGGDCSNCVAAQAIAYRACGEGESWVFHNSDPYSNPSL